MKKNRFLKRKEVDQNKFVTKEKFKANRQNQFSAVPRTIQLLKNFGTTEEEEKCLEFFFYTDTIEKSKALSKELEKFDYEVYCEESASDKKHFLVTGWTTKMKISDKVVSEWATQMCDLGYKFDCEFDGWGTFSKQDEETT